MKDISNTVLSKVRRIERKIDINTLMSDLTRHQTKAVQLIFLGICKSDIILVIVIWMIS